MSWTKAPARACCGFTAVRPGRWNVLQRPGDAGKTPVYPVRTVCRASGHRSPLDFALRCREEKRLLKAKDWLKLALDAPDAADHPDLCAVARYYQAVTDGQNPDLTELQAVAAGSAWACLLLGDLAGEEEQRLTWYTQGAGIGKDSRTEECRRKQQKILQQREERRRREEERARTARAAAEAATARKAAEAQEAARRKAAEEREAAERKATEDGCAGSRMPSTPAGARRPGPGPTRTA